MNFRNILAEIEKTDPEVYERLSVRRHALKSFGTKVAVAALPIALGSMFKKAYGKTSSNAIVDALNFALELEYLEYNFYHVGNNTGGLIPTNDLPGFQTIEAHELEHINFLTTGITALGGVPYTPRNYNNPASSNPAYIPSGTYDFTAGGTYHVFEDYNAFLIVAQTFEDTGVRAYKGQVPTVAGNATVLNQALQIGCTEARHAAHVRYVRRLTGPAAPDYPAPWITNNIPPKVALQANYLGEDNVQQEGVTTTSLTGINGTVPQASATAAFDEPLDQATVAHLVAPFFLP